MCLVPLTAKSLSGVASQSLGKLALCLFATFFVRAVSAVAAVGISDTEWAGHNGIISPEEIAVSGDMVVVRKGVLINDGSVNVNGQLTLP